MQLWNAEKRSRVAIEILYAAKSLDRAMEIAEEEGANELVVGLAAIQMRFVEDLKNLVKEHKLDKVKIPVVK